MKKPSKVLWQVLDLGNGIFSCAAFREGSLLGYVRRRRDGAWCFLYNGLDEEVLLFFGVKEWDWMTHAMLAVQEYFEQRPLEKVLRGG